MSKRISHRGVVVGADGSPSSRVAVKWAARAAAMRHVPLTVVHVVPPLSVAASALAWPAGRVPQEVLEIQENDGRRVIADAIKVVEDSATGGNRPEIDSEMLFGERRTGPCRSVKRRPADGGRMPWPNRTASPLARVGQHRVDPSRSLSRRGDPRRGSVLTSIFETAVMVGIDGSRASELAMEIAFDEASWRGVDLVALHVWSDTDMSTVFGIDSSAVQSAADKTLAESLAGWQERYPEVTVQRVVEFERPVRHLLEQAEKAQLVVVGSHGRGGFAGMMLGSVSTAVAQEARVPVIVARQH